MSHWSAVKAKRLLAALLRIGWTIKRESGSHRTLSHEGCPTLCSHFMTPMRLVPEWLLESPSTPDFSLKICESVA